MAIAAYASVLSLLHVLDNVRHPSRLRHIPDNTQIEFLQQKLLSLQELFDDHSSEIGEGMEDLVREIPEVTNDAEDVIDRYMVDQLRGPFDDRNDDGKGSIVTSFSDDINEIIQKVKSINQKLMQTVVENHERTSQYDQQQPPRVSVPPPTSSKPKNTVVGFEEQFLTIMDMLFSIRSPELAISSIVGMGGSGKTTLAMSAFDGTFIQNHFHIRIWVTISQEYSPKKTLRDLLAGVDPVYREEEYGDKTLYEFKFRLYKMLLGRRYLIVIDDVWSTEVWDDLRSFLPDKGNGSQIIVTTRLLSLANSLCNPHNIYIMKFLGQDNSWDLFSARAFVRGGWSLELEEIGREISKGCKGLPLALVSIGDLLANSNMTREFWQLVAKDVASFANSANDGSCLRILSSSYHHLPIHLKPCFLYMRHLPEDSDIKVSVLIKDWVAHGFVKPISGKTLEEAAREYLEDLIDRNVVLVREKGSTGKIKTCGIHNLLRDLCAKESHKERILEVPRMQSISNGFQKACFLCEAKGELERLQLSEVVLGSQSTSHVSPLVCSSCKSRFPKLTKLRFLRAVKNESLDLPQTTGCRCLSIDYYWYCPDVPCTLHLLWNLQTLYCGKPPRKFQAILPVEIWSMPQLRHVKMTGYELPDPTGTTEDLIVLENLQTLATIKHFKWTEEIIRRIPNLQKLGVYYDSSSIGEKRYWPYYCLQNLVHLQKLESLSIRCAGICLDMNSIVLPHSLKKMTLGGCRILWEDLSIISWSPNLEVLELLFGSVVGQKWSPVEGEFLLLKYLKLEGLNLEYWTAEDTHFPALETLVLHDMKHLKKIPPKLGDLRYLKLICVERKSIDNVIASAKGIVEKQKGNGNKAPRLRIRDYSRRTTQIGGAYTKLMLDNHGSKYREKKS